MQKRPEHRPTSRVLDILDLLAANSQGLTLTEIAESIGAPKSSIFPVVHTMSGRKFISADKNTSKYTIGISAFCVGEAYSNNKDTLQFINAEMHSIVSKIGEICQMGIFDAGDVLYVAKVDSTEAIRLISYVGKRLPAYCTALGKALMCNLTLEQIESYYPKDLSKVTEKTVSSIDDLWAQLREIHRTNVAYEKEECTKEVQCVAVPLVSEGKTIAALSISMPSYRATDEKKSACTMALLEAKEKIETFFASTHFDIDDFLFSQVSRKVQRRQ